MTRNRHWATWYLFTTLLGIFNICTIRIFDGYNWPFYAVTANVVLSLGGLIFQMHVNETAKKRMLTRAAQLILFLNSVSVFLMLGLSMFILTSQYHNPQTPYRSISSAAELEQAMGEKGHGVTLMETDKLYIYCPNYDEISFAAGERPSREDESIVMCVAAAFQDKYQLDFRHSNIVGWHTAGGQLERGKPQARLGAFTYVDGNARIWSIDEAEEAIREAADRGGCGYQQFIVLADGERGGHQRATNSAATGWWRS